MTIRYCYVFGNGKEMSFPKELPFNLLKIAVDANHGLVSMKKVLVIKEPERVHEIQIQSI